MMEKDGVKRIEILNEVEATICEFTDRTCVNCYYYDGSYHGGYCDLHKTDTSPGRSCGDWVEA